MVRGLLYIATVSLIGSFSEATVSCSQRHLGDQEFEKIYADIRTLKRMDNRQADEFLYPKRKTDAFWKSGWPHLLQEAKEQGTTVDVLFADALALMDLMGQRYSFRWNREASERFVLSLHHLYQFEPRQKLKPRDWRHVTKVMSGLYSLGTYLTWFQYKFYERPRFHPYAEQTAFHIERLFDVIEELTLDRLLDDLARPPKPKNQAPETDTAEAELPPKERPPQNPVRRSELDDSNLAVVLAENLPITEERVYRATTIYGQQLAVSIERSIIKEMSEPNEAAIIRKLLRGILMGNGTTSGIKTMFDLGPGIVELKGVFNGHKRIIGCLLGRLLILKRFIDLPASRASYSRRIPANLCL